MASKLARLAVAVGALAACFNAAGCAAPTAPDPLDLGDYGAVSATMLDDGGGHEAYHVTVQASQLQPGAYYEVSNAITTIQGDIPANTRIDVIDGRLVVEGNIEDGATVTAEMPVRYARYRSGGKGSHGYTTREFGLLHPENTTPGIIVTGSIGKDAKVISNAGVQAECSVFGAKVKSDYGRPINITARAQFKC